LASGTFKRIPLPSMEGLRAFKDELATEWGNMLAHQLPVLPPVDSFWDALVEFFAWLARGFVPPAPAAYQLAEGETLVRLQLGRIGRIMGGRPGLLEMVRFAAANRLCVDLVYRKENDQVVRSRIEPYSLRRTRAGEIVLHVIRADDQQHRSYRIDRIQEVQVSQQTFVPRYAVELSPEAWLSIPPTACRAQAYTAPRSSAARSRPRSLRQLGLDRKRVTGECLHPCPSARPGGRAAKAAEPGPEPRAAERAWRGPTLCGVVGGRAPSSFLTGSFSRMSGWPFGTAEPCLREAHRE
jgi:WYL domain